MGLETAVVDPNTTKTISTVSDTIDSVPLEILVYVMTIVVIGSAFLALKHCGYSMASIFVEVVESETDVEIKEGMDLDFIFPSFIKYVEMRVKKEGRSMPGLKICMFIFKSKFIQKVIKKYIRKKILPALIESKIE